MVDGIALADIFLIFSESDDCYFFKMRPNFGIKASHLIILISVWVKSICFLQSKPLKVFKHYILCPTPSQNTNNPKADNLAPFWDQNYLF